jgi:adhesin transport system outer membrane protein
MLRPHFLPRLPLLAVLLVTTMWSGPVMAQAQETALMTLRDAVAAGVSENPEYGSIANNRRATDEELRQAEGGYYPSIDMNADAGWDVTRTDPNNARADTNNLWRYQVGLTLTQMLFDGYETKYEVERQRHRVVSAAHRVRETTEFIGLDIVEAYLNILRQRELLDIARANIERHVDIERQMMESSSAGRTTDADVEQARARLAAARANESSVRESLRNAEAAYNRLVGAMPRTLVRPAMPSTYLSETVEEEVKVALDASPTLAGRLADVYTAEAEARQSVAPFYPQVDFQANVSRANDASGSENNTERARALVLMNWNLYRGGADTSRVREGVYRAAQTKETRANAARQLEENVRNTWAQMVAASERALEFGVQAQANEKVVAAYLDQFNLDRRTLLDVLDSQNENFVSRSNVINAQYVELFAAYRLLALKGQLLPMLEVAYPAGTNPADHYW